MYDKFPKDFIITDEDEKSFYKNVEYIDKKLPDKFSKAKKRISFVEDLVALYRYLKDDEVNWYRKAIVITALVYFISPIDAIPDLSPLVGYLDDLGVITAAIKYLGSEIKPYYRVKETSDTFSDENESEKLF
ncbi:MAG: YkvA family protein [Ignavibacteria bacterium]|nr:YkvA family protein [Ignavibacteria bacterium]